MKDFSLTTQAKHQVNKACEENNIHAICLGIKGGGCAGFEYEWSSIVNEEDINPGSYILFTGQGHFVVDEAAKMFLEGAEVDYKKSLLSSGFEINNPNAQSACGCGVSVNFDVDSTNELASPAK